MSIFNPQMRTYRSVIFKLLAYAWAAPNTALGILFGLVILGLGGKMHVVSGVAEFHGGIAGRYFASRPRPFCFGAITLGHVILGTCQKQLAALRTHEHVHVRQYERWGILFLPAYALSSLWEAIHGRCGYRNNFFERQAYAIEDHQKLHTALCAKQDKADDEYLHQPTKPL